MGKTAKPLPIDAELLDLLRCPVALQDPKGIEKGNLELVNDSWLVCHFSGMKYPIINEVPVMLIEEGQKWKDIPISDLPTHPFTKSES